MAYEFTGRVTIDAIITVDGEPDYKKALRVAKNLHIDHIQDGQNVRVEVSKFRGAAEIKAPGIKV